MKFIGENKEPALTTTEAREYLGFSKSMMATMIAKSRAGLLDNPLKIYRAHPKAEMLFLKKYLDEFLRKAIN